MEHELFIKRIYLPAEEADGCRILIDRLWPRGVSKAKAGLYEWKKDIAPSTELRKWFNHDESRFAEFAARYCAELDVSPSARDFAAECSALLKTGSVSLIYGAKDETCNQAVVLRNWIVTQEKLHGV